MSYLVIQPKDKKEEQLITGPLTKMSVKVSTEEDEDRAFVKAMKEVDFSNRVPLEEVKKLLRK